ncbi:BstXI family restriction endonuclease [Rhodococcus ruber]|uniref:BstXI family restriction endonuclease n=1 Tax=Rhodococcus ruber TaxID=1830 RepID=UPI001F2021C2|nr:BstXI family restriction endonuclease [Rhodococcus ruber]MCF8783210.1 BstXI family restriction endonuclease [Rhodococcus ruber]
MTSTKRVRLPKLPDLIEQKLTKTGYTRGATTKEIYQNRVTRSNPVLIPWSQWDLCAAPDDGSDKYENGFIVLVEPAFYFGSTEAEAQLRENGLELGRNALIFFSRRADWVNFVLGGDPTAPPRRTLPSGKSFVPANSRTDPLGGVYLARIHATVSDGVTQVIEGFCSNKMRGAGIRVYEYASSKTISDARIQLECLMWHCHDADEVVGSVIGSESAEVRRSMRIKEANEMGLLDYERLRSLRMINSNNETVCPLCLNKISAADFMKRSEQAEGRETYDLTTTEVSLFHIEELRVGKLQHKPYNLAWGHHFCNVVVKDAGIIATLKWMKGVLDNNGDSWAEIEAAEQSVEQAVQG